MSPRQFNLGSRLVDLDASVIKTNQDEVTLTPQEVAILECLLNATQQTCSHEDLYREVGGFRSKPQGRAVHYALRRLRIKLEDDPEKANHLKTVRGRGYRLDNVTLAREADAALWSTRVTDDLNRLVGGCPFDLKHRLVVE